MYFILINTAQRKDSPVLDQFRLLKYFLLQNTEIPGDKKFERFLSLISKSGDEIV